MVIVGVDGSDTSSRALAWAVAQGERMSMPVLAVCAWERAARGPDAHPASPYAAPERDECIATRIAWFAIEPHTFSHVPVTATAAEGDPVDVLIHLARPEDIVVVGARGIDRLDPDDVGTVAHGCVSRAPCPVVVVPDEPHHTIHDLVAHAAEQFV